MPSRWGSRGLVFAAGMILVTACAKHGDQATQPPKPATAPAVSSTLAIAGRLMDGADQASIRAYLQTVREIKPKRFSVHWSADTVPVSRDEAMRSLRGVNEDGTLYTFASSEPIVSHLQPGHIVWIWGITIGRIDRVATLDDTTLVHVKHVPLTEALTDADIEFASPINFADAYAGLRRHLPRTVPAQKTAAMRAGSPYLRVMLNTEPGDLRTPPPDANPDSPPPDDEDDSDYGLVAATQDGLNGKIAGFEYSLGYKVFPSHLTFEIQARKEEENEDGSGESNEIHRDQRAEFFELVKEKREAREHALEEFKKLTELQKVLNEKLYPEARAELQQPNLSATAKASLETQIKLDEKEEAQARKEYRKWEQEVHEHEIKIKALAAAGALAKQVFYLVSDNLDIRFRGKMDLNRLGVASAIRIASGVTNALDAHFTDLSGRIDVEFVGRLGKPGNGGVSVPVVHIPVSFDIPLPIEGIPFVLQLAADYLVKVGLSGNHAAQHFAQHFEFGGSAGLTAGSTKTDADSKLTSTEPQIEDETAESPGTSGAVLGIQLPRIGLGIGAFGTSGMVYLDTVNVLTITNSASVAALNPRCKRITFDRVSHVGIDVSVMPIPIPLVQSVASHALSQSKEIAHPPQWKRIEPDIQFCRLSGD